MVHSPTQAEHSDSTVPSKKTPPMLRLSQTDSFLYVTGSTVSKINAKTTFSKEKVSFMHENCYL